MSFRVIALVLGCFAVVVAALIAAGVAPPEAAAELVKGSLGSPRAIGNTLRETTPLLLAGLAVFVALRAGLFNIGVEGQFVLGAMSAVVVGLRLPGPLGVALGIMVGAAVGALWAFPAGWIKAYRGGHEVITTIMLNSLALLLSGWLVSGPIRNPEAGGSPTTRILAEDTRLPNLLDQPLRVNLALVLGLLAIAGFAWWLRRTVAGYELRAVGANPTAAAVAGVNVRNVTVRAMSASGALAGLAGAMHALAYEGRFFNGFSPGYGFDSLGVALLAGSSPWGIVPSALAFGALKQGSVILGTLGVPRGISGVLLGLLIIAFAAVRYRRYVRDGG